LEWLQRKSESIYAGILAGSKKKLNPGRPFRWKAAENSMQSQGPIAKKIKVGQVGGWFRA